MLGYFKIGYSYSRVKECHAGLENWPRKGNSSPHGLEITKNYCENTHQPENFDA